MMFMILSISVYAYTAYKLVKDIKHYAPIWKRKWIKGECRHLCILCQHHETCKKDMKLDKNYAEGFDDGFAEGFDTGHTEGVKEGKMKMYENVVKLLKKN